MIVFGYIAALFIGISLGLIGGGGSILTVPVLVYLFHISPVMATSYSLFIVGSTSLVGAVKNYQHRQVSLRTAFTFGTSSLATVYVLRKFFIPKIPRILFTLGNFEVTYSLITMLVFAVLMVLASYSMIRNTISDHPQSGQHFSLVKMLVLGMLVGVVTGFLGAGGGFLIIPSLVILMKLPMKKAIGTSLFIIALNSLIGFIGDFGHFPLDWSLLVTISSLAIIGIFIGNALGSKVEAHSLRKGFGWFVLMMGLYIIARELHTVFIG